MIATAAQAGGVAEDARLRSSTIQAETCLGVIQHSGFADNYGRHRRGRR